jgi:hypothetical protein
VTPEATLRLGPALMDSVERRAVPLPEEAGTNSVTGNFYGVSSYGIDCWPGSAVSLPPAPTAEPHSSVGLGPFRTEFGEAVQRYGLCRWTVI